MLKDNALNIYTDGTSLPSPRAGGIGYRFILLDCNGVEILKKDYEQPGYSGATNNQMELLACIKALEEASELNELDKINKIEIFTDSLYVKDNYSRAIFDWPRKRWRNQYGKPISNADLWKKLINCVKKLNQRMKRVNINWVKGHFKDDNNKAVDRLARRSSKMPINKPISIVHARRKHSKYKTRAGSILMKGQRISIRIITAEYMRVQRANKYRCEVISKRNKLFQCVDTIFSDIDLRAGHSYFVTLNDNQNNPTIVKMHYEIKRENDINDDQIK